MLTQLALTSMSAAQTRALQTTLRTLLPTSPALPGAALLSLQSPADSGSAPPSQSSTTPPLLGSGVAGLLEAPVGAGSAAAAAPPHGMVVF